MLGRKKLGVHLSLRALRQAAGLTPGSSHPSSLQDVPPALVIVETFASTVVVTVTLARCSGGYFYY